MGSGRRLRGASAKERDWEVVMQYLTRVFFLLCVGATFALAGCGTTSMN